MTLPLFPVIEPRTDIVAITGGRYVTPTRASLVAFVLWLRAREAGTLVHGDCNPKREGDKAWRPVGVDQIVAAFVTRETDVSVEAWPALWNRLGNGAGPRRNGKMLEGDRTDWGGEHLHRPVDLLVAWPGNDGTRNCCEQADRLGIDWVPIAHVEQWVRERGLAA